MSAFTPGPWHRNIKPAAKYPTIFAGRNTHVAVVQSRGLTDEEVEANCDLIAAASELLAALEGLRYMILDSRTFSHPEKAERMRTADAAIAKATGSAT